MEPISNSGQGFRFGLSRLCSCWQQNECVRHVVCGLLVHLSLHPLLAAALLFSGCPMRIAEVVALVCVLAPACGLEQAIDTKLGSLAARAAKRAVSCIRIGRLLFSSSRYLDYTPVDKELQLGCIVGVLAGPSKCKKGVERNYMAGQEAARIAAFSRRGFLFRVEPLFQERFLRKDAGK